MEKDTSPSFYCSILILLIIKTAAAAAATPLPSSWSHHNNQHQNDCHHHDNNTIIIIFICQHQHTFLHIPGYMFQHFISATIRPLHKSTAPLPVLWPVLYLKYNITYENQNAKLIMVSRKLLPTLSTNRNLSVA